MRRRRDRGLGRLGKPVHGQADSESGQIQNGPAQESSPDQRVFHFNSDGGKLQEDWIDESFPQGAKDPFILLQSTFGLNPVRFNRTES
jgi:hypothetical protein